MEKTTQASGSRSPGGKLNYHHLYHFWVVAQEGSLVGASRRLGVRHSTLSAQLKALERTLGGRLLLRRPRGVLMTPLGELVGSYCEQIFRLGAELEESVAGRGTRAARLGIGLLPSVPRALLFEPLGPLMGGDGARLEFSMGNLRGLCEGLVAGRLHVVFSDRLPVGGSEAQVFPHLLGESRVGLYGTRRLAERYREDFPRSLDGAPVLLPVSGALRDGLASWFAEEGIRPRVAGEFDDAPMMQGCAARGLGLAPVGRQLAEDARRRYGLVAVGSVPRLVVRLYALTLGRRVRHPGVQQLIERCRTGGPRA